MDVVLGARDPIPSDGSPGLAGWQQLATDLDGEWEGVQQFFSDAFVFDAVIFCFITCAYEAGVKVLQF